MEDDRFWIFGTLMGVPPWGLLVWISIPIGIAGLAVQFVGLAMLLWAVYKQ